MEKLFISAESLVHAIDYLVSRLSAEDRLLLIDDVFDSGFSLEAVIEELRGDPAQQARGRELLSRRKGLRVGHVTCEQGLWRGGCA